MAPTTKQEAAVRIRNNQRRSRARRKEYIQGLEQRVRLLEAQGTENAIEMQQVARRVAHENRLLRARLMKYGQTEVEINRYLSRYAPQGTRSGGSHIPTILDVAIGKTGSDELDAVSVLRVSSQAKRLISFPPLTSSLFTPNLSQTDKETNLQIGTSLPCPAAPLQIDLPNQQLLVEQGDDAIASERDQQRNFSEGCRERIEDEPGYEKILSRPSPTLGRLADRASIMRANKGRESSSPPLSKRTEHPETSPLLTSLKIERSLTSVMTVPAFASNHLEETSERRSKTADIAAPLVLDVPSCSRRSEAILQSPNAEGIPSTAASVASTVNMSGSCPRESTMSCEQAAQIIADMRGLDDRTQIFAEMGCPPAIDCRIHNKILFEILGR